MNFPRVIDLPTGPNWTENLTKPDRNESSRFILPNVKRCEGDKFFNRIDPFLDERNGGTLVYFDLPGITNLPEEANWPDNFKKADTDESYSSFFYFNFPCITSLPGVPSRRYFGLELWELLDVD